MACYSPYVAAWGIFTINAATYGFAIVVIARVSLPRRAYHWGEAGQADSAASSA